MQLKIRHQIILAFLAFSVICFFIMQSVTKSIVDHAVISKSLIVKIILTFLFGYFGVVTHIIVMTLLSVLAYLLSKGYLKEEFQKGFAITSIICLAACFYVAIAAMI